MLQLQSAAQQAWAASPVGCETRPYNSHRGGSLRLLDVCLTTEPVVHPEPDPGEDLEAGLTAVVLPSEGASIRTGYGLIGRTGSVFRRPAYRLGAYREQHTHRGPSYPYSVARPSPRQQNFGGPGH